MHEALHCPVMTAVAGVALADLSVYDQRSIEASFNSSILALVDVCDSGAVWVPVFWHPISECS